MMKILLIGNGAREHIIAEKLAKDCELYAIMSKKNPAIVKLCKEYWICDIESPEAVTKVLRGKSFNIGFASPDAVLAAGISDALNQFCKGVASPSKAAARIEWDKSYMRQLIDKYKIHGSIKYRLTNDEKTTKKTMEEFGEVAIKPLGLTGGKGVKISGDHFKTVEEGMEYARFLLKKDGVILIEEKLEGEEFSLQCFSDGKNIVAMPPVQDHKRAFSQDIGPNTGGMGSYSTGGLLPFMEKEDLDNAKEILQAVIDAMAKEGNPFKGVLYGQFMTTKNGVCVVEFNSRFADPESMNVLALLQDSLTKIFSAITNQRLTASSVRFEEACTVVKYLVPTGYPENPAKDVEVWIDNKGLQASKAAAYYASIYENEGRLLTAGSRAFGVLGKAKTLKEAEKIAEKGCHCFSGLLWHREDIGTEELIQRRVEHMKKLRV